TAPSSWSITRPAACLPPPGTFRVPTTCSCRSTPDSVSIGRPSRPAVWYLHGCVRARCVLPGAWAMRQPPWTQRSRAIVRSSGIRSRSISWRTGGMRSNSLPATSSPVAPPSIRAIPQKHVPTATSMPSAAFVSAILVPAKREIKTLSSVVRPAPPDQSERERALDPSCSILVQAPAGSGKTNLLTRRFLRLLTEVDDPSHVVAITFTIAAAAEMRHRIVSELEAASAAAPFPIEDELEMSTIALRALDHARALGWNLNDLSGVLRISTIDSFCREVALRQPLLSTLAAGLEVTDQPEELYRRAARRTLLQLDTTDPAHGPAQLRTSIASLLLWRDNNWQELEDHL